MSGTAEPVTTRPASSVAGVPEKAPLDDVMLAMDVVDTLRHRQDLVVRELAGEAREKQLIDKLREIYQQQGIDVPDSVLLEGVKALEQSRFVYTPPKPGLGTSLARLYVQRKKWGPAAIAIALLLVVGLGGYFLAYRPYQQGIENAARIEMTETLPGQMDALYQSIFEETKVEKAVQDAEVARQRGKTAAAEGNRAGALAAIETLTGIRDKLREVYTLRVVSRPDVLSGFWRTPNSNLAATNHYLTVEAIGEDGKPISRAIRSEETRQTKTVALWGERVSQSVFNAFQADAQDDGIIQRSIVAIKEFGYLEPRELVDLLGGQVTEWDNP